jgi:hypothetical protein
MSDLTPTDIADIVWLVLLGCAILAGLTYMYLDGKKFE